MGVIRNNWEVMEPRDRIFRQPYKRFLLLYFALLSFLGFGFNLVSLQKIEPVFWFMVVLFGSILLVIYLTSGTKISEAEIATENLLESRTIKWSEIVRVSICGYHNMRQSNLVSGLSNNGNSLILRGVDKNTEVIIAVDTKEFSQLVGILFRKRPDLFEAGKGCVVDFLTTRSTLGEKFFWEYLFIASSVFIVYQTGFYLAALILGIVLSFSYFFSTLNLLVTNPFSIILENGVLRFVYLSRTVVAYAASEILSIKLEKVWERQNIVFSREFLDEGAKNKDHLKFIPHYTYHNIYINIKDKSPMILQWSGQLVYLILNNWYKKNAEIGLTNKQN